MLLNRAAHFFDPAVAWQLLENQPAPTEPILLLEQHIKRYGAADFYLGLVVATGERALWLKVPGRPVLTANLPDAL